MVDFIMRFISTKNERFDNYPSYLRKYCIVDFIWWAIHRLLFFISSAIVIKYVWYGVFGFLGLFFFLTFSLYTVSYACYYFMGMTNKWSDMKSYLHRR